MVGSTTPDDGEVDATENADGFASCAGCGRLILADQERCTACLANATSPPATSESEGPHPGLGHPFKPTGSLVVALRMLFTALILLEGFLLGALLVLQRMTGRLIENPFAYTLTEYKNQQQLGQALSWVEIALMGVLAALFMAWMFRSLRNLPALGAFRQRYGKGWAIGSWFVPIGNLWIPKKIVDDLWKSSDPGVGWKASNPWQVRSVPLSVHLWWATFLGGRFLFSISNAMLSGDDPLSIRNGIRFGLVGIVVTLAGAGLAMWLVAEISRRQADRVRETGRPFAEREATRGLAANIAVASILAIGMALFGYQFFDAGESSSTIGGTVASGAGHYEGFGLSFDYDSDFVAAASGLGGDQPSQVGGVVLMGEPSGTASGGVTWVWLPGAAELDHILMVDDLINGMTGPGDLVVRSDPVDLEGGPAEFTARNFRIIADADVVKGAVAAGACADTEYVVILLWASESQNRSETIDTALDTPGMRNILSILTTLDC